MKNYFIYRLSSIFLTFFVLIAITGYFHLAHAESFSPQISSKKLQKLTNKYLKKYHQVENISSVTLTVDTGNRRETVSSGNTDSNLYQIGSITKSFISAIILQIEAEQNFHFNIDDKLSHYLPQYSTWGNVTIRQLLNMTSGIPDYLADNNYLQDLANNPDKEWSPEEQMSYVAKKHLLFKSGTKWDYSNTNYIILGMIITKLTGHTIEEEITNRFLAPNNPSHLNLKNTFYVSHHYPTLIDSRIVRGYRFGGNIGKFIPLKTDITKYSLSYAGAAGAMVSTTDDITQWIRMLLTTNNILQPKQLNELKTLVSTVTGQPINSPNAEDPNGFGLGIGFSYVPDLPSIVANFEGMTLGYRAQYIYIQNENLVIAATTNSSVDDDNDHLIDLLNNAYHAR